MSEKGQLETIARPHKKSNTMLKFAIAGLSLLGYYFTTQEPAPLSGYADLSQYGGQCPPIDKVYPDNGFDLDYFKTSEFRNLSLVRLQGSLRIPTESSEDYGLPGEDKRWDIFKDQETYFLETFPLVHENLKLEIVNHHGLVYTWKGKNPAAKPALLMSHLDVVPVGEDTAGAWKFPAYDAHYDGHFIWARGALDAKHPVLSIFNAAEELLGRGFTPERDILFAFGFDEESSGHNGAAHIAKFLEDRFGADSFEVVLDEGGLGVSRSQGVNIAMTSISEKGHLQVEIVYHSKGGHSSMTTGHTGIGIASDLVTVIENNPHPSKLNEPTLSALECIALHSPNMGWLQKKIILNARTNRIARGLLLKSLKSNELFGNLLLTTQAVNIFHSGVKINALPEITKFSIDHRVSVDSSIAEVRQKLEADTLTVAEKYDTGVKGFNGTWLRESKNGPKDVYFELNVMGVPVHPAPISPGYGETWSTFAGTVKRVYEDFGGQLLDMTTNEVAAPDNIQVIPGLHTVNTDTKYYTGLTKNIFRFIPFRVEDYPNLHAIDEHLSLNGHVEGIVFYFEYMQNL